MSFYRSGEANISAADLQITDSRYGQTLPMSKCTVCGFLQCDTQNLTELYEQLEDVGYIESSEQRKKQFDFLLKQTLPHISGFVKGNDFSKLNVLDIGAGTGLFVKSALEHGLTAQGVEPSTYLANYAISQGLPVVNSSIPDYPTNYFDAIYMIDVLEHIADPSTLLGLYKKILKPGGVFFVTTPDVSSAFARFMGSRWWHYRLAHVGYYNKKTLNRIMTRAGFSLKRYMPVWWCFTGEYAFERLGIYLPILKGKRCPKIIANLIIPITFWDSILAVYVKSKESCDFQNQ